APSGARSPRPCDQSDELRCSIPGRPDAFRVPCGRGTAGGTLRQCPDVALPAGDRMGADQPVKGPGRCGPGSTIGASQPRPFLEFVVAGDDNGRVLSHVLRRRLGMSRGFSRQLKRGPYVLVNGRPAALRETVTAGDRVTLYVPPHLASNVRPEP